MKSLLEGRRLAMIHMHSDRKRKWQPRRRYLGILFLICSMTMLSACERSQETIPPLMEPVKVKLDTETAKIDSLYNIDIFDASVIPYIEGLSSENDFVIQDIHVSIGDQVKKGQILISMERSAYTEAYEAMKEEIDFIKQNNAYENQQTEYDIKIAELELAQLKKQGHEKEIKRKELNIEELKIQHQYTKELRQLELEEKLRQLSRLEEKLNYPDIVAPYDGTITYLAKLHKGDTLQAFDPVVYIADDSRLSIQSDYISDYLIKNADQIYAMIDDKEYDLINIPYTEEEFKYRLFNNLPRKSTFAFEDRTNSVKSGAYACVCLISNRMDNVLTVPKKAVYKEGQVSYVYRIIDGERVRQEVEIGGSNKLRVQIISGLKEGDEVYVQQ
jgi:RND family efflux transporter MFP subunit